jgi:hypothetical protein
VALAHTVNAPPRMFGLESTDSLRTRLQPRHLKIITDDNMGQEWIKDVAMNWRSQAAQVPAH